MWTYSKSSYTCSCISVNSVKCLKDPVLWTSYFSPSAKPMAHDFPKFMFDIGIRFSKYMKPTYRIVDKMLFYAVKIA